MLPVHVPVATNCSWLPIGSCGFAGVTEIERNPASVPVPDKFNVCGLVLALSFIVNAPLRLPRAVGVNVTETAQLAPALSVLGDSGQVDVCAKSPEAATLEIVSGTVWLFFRVTLCFALVEPNA